MLVDTHCHLNDPQFTDDRETVVSNGLSAGVSRMMVVGYTPESCETALQMERFDGIGIGLGFHPDSADKLPDDWMEMLEGYIRRSEKLVAIGEIGLDFYWHKKEEAARQFDLFTKQVILAQKLGLPVSIHSREAVDEVMDVLAETGIGDAGAVLHAFTGTAVQAERAIKMGLYLGAGGIVTFKKADAVREALKVAGLERILLETDCPYLAPTPHRGKRNEPAYLPLIASSLAEVFDTTPETVSEITTQNALRVFARLV